MIARAAAAAALLCLLLEAGPASAWSILLTWKAVQNATGYLIEKSDNLGATWTEVARPTGLTYTASGTEPSMVLFRVKSCRVATCSPTPNGYWHHEGWRQK